MSSGYETRKIQPLLIVISGPSGAGKDSVVKRMQQRGLPFHFVVTATNRPRRVDEVHGKDYWFVTAEEFTRMIENNELIEHSIVYGDHKGIPREQVKQALASGKDVIMRLDVQGAETIRKLVPEALLIFIATESERELVERLSTRDSETAAEQTLRIATARKELNRVEAFDYLIINREAHLDDTVEKVRSIIEAEHLKVCHRKVTL